MNIAINGFGRIGKSFLRVLLADTQAMQHITVSVINIGPADINAMAHSFKYDTIMGTYQYDVQSDINTLYITDSVGKRHKIALIAELDPIKCNWGSYDIDWVVEATGKFTKKELAQKHIQAGAKKILITAPAHGEDVTIIPGINYEKLKSTDTVVSMGSCTTNALVPMLWVLENSFGIERASMTTIHAYTNTQTLLDIDATSKDLRRSRAAALNIVPTTTGAMQVIDRIMPSLAGKITGSSLRVPVADVSLVDLTVLLKKSATQQDINSAYQDAAAKSLKQILAYTTIPLVSSDYLKNSFSVTIDSLLTEVTGNLCKVFGWYDNEWGYSARLKDFLLFARTQK